MSYIAAGLSESLDVEYVRSGCGHGSQRRLSALGWNRSSSSPSPSHLLSYYPLSPPSLSSPLSSPSLSSPLSSSLSSPPLFSYPSSLSPPPFYPKNNGNLVIHANKNLENLTLSGFTQTYWSACPHPPPVGGWRTSPLTFTKRQVDKDVILEKIILIFRDLFGFVYLAQQQLPQTSQEGERFA